jgi:hypothetical protein
MPVDTAKVWKVKINGIMMVDVLNKEEFGRCIREIFSADAARTFSRLEMEHFAPEVD